MINVYQQKIIENLGGSMNYRQRAAVLTQVMNDAVAIKQRNGLVKFQPKHDQQIIDEANKRCAEIIAQDEHCFETIKVSPRYIKRALQQVGQQ